MPINQIHKDIIPLKTCSKHPTQLVFGQWGQQLQVIDQKSDLSYTFGEITEEFTDIFYAYV